MDINQAMLQIKSLDSSAHIEFSEYTDKWYVSTRISIGGDGFLRGITEHRDSPEEAVHAYLAALQRVDEHDLDHYLVTTHRNGRRHSRWNGAAFAEVDIPSPGARQ